jgi:hypothetical protein
LSTLPGETTLNPSDPSNTAYLDIPRNRTIPNASP